MNSKSQRSGVFYQRRNILEDYAGFGEVRNVAYFVSESVHSINIKVLWFWFLTPNLAAYQLNPIRRNQKFRFAPLPCKTPPPAP